jgi:uncharacterized protein (TIGR02268 family)
VCLPPAQVVLLLLVLSALPAAAQLGPAGVAAELPPPSGQRLSEDMEVPVAPGRPLVLFFDAALDQTHVRRVSRELGLQRVAVGEDTLAFQLAPGLQEGTRLRLPVRFADGQAPESVNVVLVVDSPRAQGQVAVPRRPREAPGCAEALAAVRAQVAAQGAELSALREELRDRAGSLTELVATGVLTGAGVRVVALPVGQWGSVRGLRVTAARLYVARGRMAVEVEVQVERRRRKRPWSPGAVKLTLDDTPVALRSVRLLGGPLLEYKSMARLLVEWEASNADPERPPAPYALEVPDPDSGGTLRAPCLGSQRCRTEASPWKK